MIWWITGVCLLLLAWAWAVAPRLSKKTQAKGFSTYKYAHRGLHDIQKGIPENSMAAFVRAVEQGYGIELDVHLTKDGIPVVFHDAMLQRMCGQPGKIGDYTAAQLSSIKLQGSEEGIPLFCEVLAMVDGRVPLIVELKTERDTGRLCSEVNALLEGYAGEYCIESFDPRCVKWYRKNRPAVIRGQLAEFYRLHGTPMPWMGDRILRALLLNFLGRPDFVAYNILDLKRAWSFRVSSLLYRPVQALWVVRSSAQQTAAAAKQAIQIFEGYDPKKENGS